MMELVRIPRTASTLSWLSITVATLSALLKSRASLQLENAALPHQVGVLHRWQRSACGWVLVQTCRSAQVALGETAGRDYAAIMVAQIAGIVAGRPGSLPTLKIHESDLFTDKETGMEMRLVRYPAAIVNQRHTHPCAHGMYVLEGILVTNEGRFSPGSFVWFPEGEAMEHGATNEQDVVVLFITNKPFDIHYT